MQIREHNGHERGILQGFISNVLVFSTSVKSREHITVLAPHLNSIAGPGMWNFALDDCDRILRIESKKIQPKDAINLLNEYGFECEELED